MVSSPGTDERTRFVLAGSLYARRLSGDNVTMDRSTNGKPGVEAQPCILMGCNPLNRPVLSWPRICIDSSERRQPCRKIYYFGRCRGEP